MAGNRSTLIRSEGFFREFYNLLNAWLSTHLLDFMRWNQIVTERLSRALADPASSHALWHDERPPRLSEHGRNIEIGTHATDRPFAFLGIRR